MSAAKHTPGPCTIREFDAVDGYFVLISDGNGDLFAKAFDKQKACLIAAAPDTAARALAFTYTVERFMRAGDGSDPRVPPTEAEVAQALYALRAHIAKATGSAS